MQDGLPGITERIKSVYIDYFMLCLILIIISSFSSTHEDFPFWLRILLFIFVFIGYEPLFTSLFGGTIGHYVNGMRVKRADDTSRNIPFHRAILRFVVKIVLGIVSYATINFRTDNSTIHDIVAGSVVIYKPNKYDTAQ